MEKNDEAVIFGKHMITKRKVAWVWRQKTMLIHIQNITKEALPWTNRIAGN
jgi:hypothetical protein